MSKYFIEAHIFDQILCQKYPMRFVDGLLEYDPVTSNGKTEFVVGKNQCVGLDEQGNLPIVCLIEVMAQSLGGVLGYRSYLNHIEQKIGLLLSIRRVKLSCKGVILKNTKLISSININYQDELGNIQATVDVKDQNDNPICCGSLTVCTPNDSMIKDLFGDKVF